MIASKSFVAALPDLTVIDATGEDAVSFLQGQLTNDVAGLPPDLARLAGYCSPKGRLLGSMVVWNQPLGDTPRLRMLIKADIAPALTKRLSMFVLRARVKLAVQPVQVYGVTLSTNTPTALSAAPGDAASILSHAGTLPASPWAVVQDDHGLWIAAPAIQGTARWWCIRSADAPAIADAHPADAWGVTDIQAGLPWVEVNNQELFIPQTLNLDLIDGVSFTKGCYPGQEVVARSHYRGTIKRRMAYACATLDTEIAAEGLVGQDTFEDGQDSPAGRIVNAAIEDDDTGKPILHALLEVQLANLEEAKLRAGTPDGPALALQALPYAIT